ncbi:MAG TPA: hypothetical protein VH880_15065 [Anaeromyxobacteraceae bacterium]
MRSRAKAAAAAGAFASLLAAALPGAGGAQGALAVEQRRALVRSLPRGSAFRTNGQPYGFLAGLRAVARAPGEPSGEALARAGAAAAELVEEKGGFAVFRESAAAASEATRAAGRAPTYPVAVNERTGDLGVVPGTLVVRLRDPPAAGELARDHGLSLDFHAAHLGTAFYRAPAGASLPAAAARLAADPRVRSAEIEVKEHFAGPL